MNRLFLYILGEPIIGQAERGEAVIFTYPLPDLREILTPIQGFTYYNFLFHFEIILQYLQMEFFNLMRVLNVAPSLPEAWFSDWLINRLIATCHWHTQHTHTHT